MCQECTKKPYYITTAIAYASGKPHIGNTYEIILADAIARFKREEGFDVRFQTGTDEHGEGRRHLPQRVCGPRLSGDQEDLGSDEHLL